MQKESIPDLENLPESPIALGSEISGVKWQQSSWGLVVLTNKHLLTLVWWTVPVYPALLKIMSSYSLFFLNKKAYNQLGQAFEEYSPKNTGKKNNAMEEE